MKHEDLENLSKDDHKQYVYANPTADTRNQILPANDKIVALIFRGALGHKADFLRFNTFNGETLTKIKADGTLEAPNIRADTVRLETLYTKTSHIGSLTCDLLEAGSISSSNINGINLKEFKSAFIKHEQNKNIHYQQQEINHEVIQNCGKYNHKAIDQHLDRGDIHYTVDSINHRDIKGIGKKTHEEIDQHIDDHSIHLKNHELSHRHFTHLEEDLHTQYLHTDGRRGISKLDVGKCNVNGPLTVQASALFTHGLVGNKISADKVEAEDVVADDIKSNDIYCTKLNTKELIVDHLDTRDLVVDRDLVVEGHIHCPDLDNRDELFKDHKENKNSAHKQFSKLVDGFVPAPGANTSEYLYLTSRGTWRSFGQYVEFEFENKEIISCIQDRAYSWKCEGNRLNITVRGTYEVCLFNIPSIKINGKTLQKSINTNGAPFLIRNYNDHTQVELDLPNDYARIYIKKVDDFFLNA